MLNLSYYISALFGIIGIILVSYGFLTNLDSMYSTHSLGININLIWGTVILIFAGCFGIFGKFKKQ